MPEGGIYIISAPSGSEYVGSAVSFRRRWNLHLQGLRKGTHHNKALQAAFVKYGEYALKFRPIIITSADMLLFYEQLAIDALKPKYNSTPTAGSLLGFRMSDETKAKMSMRGKGRPRTAAQLAALVKGASSNKGRTHSAETRTRVAASQRGKKLSEATRTAISLAIKSRPRSERQQAALEINRVKAKTVEAIEKGRITITARMAKPEERARMSAQTKAFFEKNAPTEAQLAALAAGRQARLECRREKMINA